MQQLSVVHLVFVPELNSLYVSDFEKQTNCQKINFRRENLRIKLFKMMSLAAYEYHRNKVYMKVQRRVLRDTLDPFDMPDERLLTLSTFFIAFIDVVS